MRSRYLLWNSGSADVVLSSGEKIAAGGFSATILLRDEMFAMFAEIEGKGLRPCIVKPCLWQEAAETLEQHQTARGHAPSDRQLEYYGLLTGDTLPPGTTRIQASDAIDAELRNEKCREAAEATGRKAKPAPANQAPTPYGKKRRSVDNLDGHLLGGRLRLMDAEKWHPRFLDGVTVLIDLTVERLEHDIKDLLHLSWPAEDNVDQRVFEGVVRLAASAAHGVDQRVLIVGSSQSIQVVGACIVRESYAIDAQSALALLSGACSKRISAPELLETIKQYRPS